MYHLAARVGGMDVLLWDTPLDVVYALEHVQLWKDGANTQARNKSDEFYDRLAEIKKNYYAQ